MIIEVLLDELLVQKKEATCHGLIWSEVEKAELDPVIKYLLPL